MEIRCGMRQSAAFTWIRPRYWRLINWFRYGDLIEPLEKRTLIQKLIFHSLLGSCFMLIIAVTQEKCSLV